MNSTANVYRVNGSCTSLIEFPGNFPEGLGEFESAMLSASIPTAGYARGVTRVGEAGVR